MGSGGQFNGVFFSLGNNASIIVCIPLFEKVVFPCIKSMRGGKTLSRATKYNFGFFFAILGCALGIAIEQARKAAPLIHCDVESGSTCFCATLPTAPEPFNPIANISTHAECTAAD